MPLKPLTGTQRIWNPARPSMPTAGTECCAAWGNPHCEEYTGSVQAVCSSLESILIAGADAVEVAEGIILAQDGIWVKVPPGSKSRACAHWGSRGTWETLSSPPRIPEWWGR